MQEIFDINLLMDEKEVLGRRSLRFDEVVADDPATQELLIDETVFDGRKDMGPDIRIVAF